MWEPSAGSAVEDYLQELRCGAPLWNLLYWASLLTGANSLTICLSCITCGYNTTNGCSRYMSKLLVLSQLASLLNFLRGISLQGQTHNYYKPHRDGLEKFSNFCASIMGCKLASQEYFSSCTEAYCKQPCDIAIFRNTSVF